jgi:hypothetical protein
MKRHLLVTVGDDSTSLFEVDFINSFFKNKADLRVTLFSVLTPSFSYPSACRGDGRIGSNPLEDKRLTALDACLPRLLSPYLTEDHISTKVVTMEEEVWKTLSWRKKGPLRRSYPGEARLYIIRGVFLFEYNQGDSATRNMRFCLDLQTP